MKNLSAAVKATKSALRILLRERELEPKAKFCLQKNVRFGLRAEQTDATQAYHLSRWIIFVILRQKQQFLRHFNHTGCLKSKYTL